MLKKNNKKVFKAFGNKNTKVNLEKKQTINPIPLIINSIFDIAQRLGGFRHYMKILQTALKIAFDQTKNYIESKLFVYDGRKYHFELNMYPNRSLKLEIKSPNKVLFAEVSMLSPTHSDVFSDELLLNNKLDEKLKEALLNTNFFEEVIKKDGIEVWKIK